MTFAGLILHNVLRRRLRAVVTAIAVAIGVTAVLALGVLTSSLRATAVADPADRQRRFQRLAEGSF